jgi:hypothetical protein
MLLQLASFQASPAGLVNHLRLRLALFDDVFENEKGSNNHKASRGCVQGEPQPFRLLATPPFPNADSPCCFVVFG